MKKLSFLLIILSLSIIFGACPPLEEDDVENILSGTVVTFDEPFELDVYKWFEILDNIARERKYVSLDLSKAKYKDGNEVGGLIKGGTYTIFDPFPATSSGKNYIISITLPNEATMIDKAVSDGAIINDEEELKNTKKFSAFRAFTSLRSVTAKNVTLIGNFAFADCTSLRNVDFPRVGTEGSPSDIHIGKYAFAGCTELKEVKFNSAAVIGGYAFKDCTSLSKIDFPEVLKIEENAFQGCKSLANVFFEKAADIGAEAFKECTGLKNVEFNAETSFSVFFRPSVFYGCKALDVLNVHRSKAVYFDVNVFANTGTAVEIHLLDVGAGDTTSNGHPQDKKFLGEGASLTLKKVTIVVPAGGEKIQENSAVDPPNIAKYIRQTYSNVDVIVIRRN